MPAVVTSWIEPLLPVVVARSDCAVSAVALTVPSGAVFRMFTCTVSTVTPSASKMYIPPEPADDVSVVTAVSSGARLVPIPVPALSRRVEEDTCRCNGCRRS